MSNLSRYSRYPLLFFAVLAFFTPCLAMQWIVAVVNDDIITKKDLYDFANFMTLQYKTEYSGEALRAKIQSIQSDLLNKLIDDRLLVQEAKKKEIRIDEAKVKSRIAEIKKQYPSEAQFQSVLAQQGLVQADIEAKVREQMMMYFFIDAQIKSKIIVQPAEVTEFYEQNPKEFEIPEQREFEVVIIDDSSLAKEVYNKVKGGQDLEEVLKPVSLSAHKMLVARGGQLKKEIEDAVFGLKTGEISPPLYNEKKYFLFWLIGTIEPRTRGLSEVQEKVAFLLFDRKMQKSIEKLIAELKSKAYIKIYPQQVSE